MLRLLTLIALALPAGAADYAPLRKLAEEAVAGGNCPGVVATVVRGGRVDFAEAVGRVTADGAPLKPDAVFDMASLTKPIATAASIHKLIELGKLKLGDPVAKHWPAFGANGKGAVTIEQCLLHTSGLVADNPVGDYAGTPAESLANICKLPLRTPPGEKFVYSDVGFITLGHVVEVVSGQSLAAFAEARFFKPLKMTDTGFNPIGGQFDRAVPTGVRDGKPIKGVVHDPRSFALGGVAGHAGLFSTAADLARFARMLMDHGELDGVRVLSPESVKRYTEPVAVPGVGQFRGRGWDVATGFSSPRGDAWPAGRGFGHTGFTGTSIWVDPPSGTAIILLTARTQLGEKKSVTGLRRKAATFVAGLTEVGTLTGIDVLRRENFARLKGKRVALVTNHTGRAADGAPTIDLLAGAEGVKLVALFSPEHGIRGELDEKVGDGTDAKTGLPVYSLYGVRTTPTAEQLKDTDVLVYDIQDIGCRFYTYISTLGHCIDAAKGAGVEVLVLDRPNPIDCATVAGPVRDPGRGSFTAYHDIPLRHGLTVGELAKLFNAEREFGAKLTIVPCENYRRVTAYDQTNLPWIDPSPNMRFPTAAMLYPGVGILETTNISVGRGTERPFEWLGAPWIDGRDLARELNARDLPGVRFVPVTRTPISSVHKGKSCGGVDILVKDWSALRPVELGLHLAAALRKLYPAAWETKNLDRLLAHKQTVTGLLSGLPVEKLVADWQPGLRAYKARRAKVLIYAE